MKHHLKKVYSEFHKSIGIYHLLDIDHKEININIFSTEYVGPIGIYEHIYLFDILIIRIVQYSFRLKKNSALYFLLINLHTLKWFNI